MDPVIVVLLVLYCLYWVKLLARLVKARSKGLKFFDSVSNSSLFGFFVTLHVILVLIVGVFWVMKHLMWVAG